MLFKKDKAYVENFLDNIFPTLYALTNEEMHEVHYNLNKWRWCELLGDKPNNWDNLPKWQKGFLGRFKLSRQHFISPINIYIERKIPYFEICMYAALKRGETAEDFCKWWDGRVFRNSIN